MHQKVFTLIAVFCIFGAGFPLHADSPGRDYHADITPYKNDINYVINTLGTTGTMGLMFKKAELERRGHQTAPVHPLAYLGYVFSDPQLKLQMGRMSSVAWTRWKSDFGKSLAKEASRGNMKDEYISDFAAKIRMSDDQVKPFIRNQQWDRFLDLLVRNAKNQA